MRRCRTTRIVVQRVLDFTRVAEADFWAPEGKPQACVAHARQLAAYLITVELELDHEHAALQLGVTRQAVSKMVAAIEERREDPALNVAIDILGADLRRRTGYRRAA
jgi:hypothetical protein